MAKRNHVPAGGPRSKNVTHPKVRTGTGSHGTRPAGVNMFGAMQGNKVTSQKGTTSYTGEKLHGGRSFQPVPFGNAVSLNVGGGGPGNARVPAGEGGWAREIEFGPSHHQRYVDQQLDAQDAKDLRERIEQDRRLKAMEGK